MSESKRIDESLTIETGDVLMLEASPHMPFILLVTAKAEDMPDPVLGSRYFICWLEHPQTPGHSDWIWERSLKVKEAWRKLASAA